MKDKPNDCQPKGEAVTDSPQPLSKEIVLAILDSKIEQLEQEHARLASQEELDVITRQTYQLEDFLDPEDFEYSEPIDFDPFIDSSVKEAQNAYVLLVLEGIKASINHL